MENATKEDDLDGDDIFADLKNRYLIYLKKFITPYEDGLIELHYYLVKVNSKLILGGGQ